MKSLILVFCGLFFSSKIYAQTKVDTKLQSKLVVAIGSFEGQVGVFVENLKTGKFATYNSDTLFPTASMIKVPIMVGIFDKIQKGELKYTQELIFKDSLRYDEGIVSSFRDSTKIMLSEVVFLMESVSDNTASLWLQGLVGGKEINRLMEMYGFKDLRVNSRTAGREVFRKNYGWGVCTPKEMATLMKKIRNGEIVSKAASDRMIRTLGYQFWDEEGLAQIPENIKFASKTGAVDRSRSETAVVYAPHGEYVYCIVTKNQKDTTYEANNAGFELIRKLAKIIWEHEEPKSKWIKSAKDEKF
jgi:beta-lactamase class A